MACFYNLNSHNLYIPLINLINKINLHKWYKFLDEGHPYSDGESKGVNGSKGEKKDTGQEGRKKAFEPTNLPELTS